MTIIFQEENFKSIRPKPLIIFFEYVIYRQDLIKKHEKRCDFFFFEVCQPSKHRICHIRSKTTKRRVNEKHEKQIIFSKIKV